MTVRAPATSSLRDVLAAPSVRVAVGLTFLVMLGYGLIVPILPLFARSFGVGRTEVGLLLTSFAVMRLVFDLVGGPLVDRFGERAVAVAGVVVVGITSALSAAAPSFTVLLVLRALGGAGSSILFAAMLNHLIRSVPADRMGRTMSLFYSSFLLGVLLGQPIGGLVAEVLGLASPLVVYGAVCLLAGALMFRYLVPVAGPGAAERAVPVREEGLAEVEAPLPSAWGRVRGLLSGRAFVTALAANLAIFWVLGAVRMTLIPLFAKEEVGVSTIGVGALLGVAALAQFAVMWTAGSMTDSRGRRAVLLPGLAALAASVAVLGWAASPWTLAAALAAVGVATGFAGVVPSAVVADVAPRESSGTAVGLYRFAGDVGLVLGPAVGGAVADVAGFVPAFLASAAPLAAAWALALRMPETLRR